MAILFAGAELGDFHQFGLPSFVTTALTYESNYTRGSVHINASGEEIQARFPASTEAWVSWGWRTDANCTSGANNVLLGNATANIMRIIPAGANVTTRTVQYWNGSAWTFLATLTLSNEGATSRYTLAAKIDAVDGFVRVYDGTTLAGEFEGDTSGFGLSDIDRIRYIWPGNSNDQWIAEVIVADEDTTSMRLATLGPTADGTNTAWTGTYADVDETGRNAADMIFSDTADQIETFVMDDVNVTALGTRIVRALVVAAHIKRGTSGPQDCAAAFRIGGVDYAEGSFDLDTNASPKKVIVENSPATGVAWTAAELNGAEIGLKSLA